MATKKKVLLEQETPVPVVLKRFAAALLVFTFGILISSLILIQMYFNV